MNWVDDFIDEHDNWRTLKARDEFLQLLACSETAELAACSKGISAMPGNSVVAALWSICWRPCSAAASRCIDYFARPTRQVCAMRAARFAAMLAFIGVALGLYALPRRFPIRGPCPRSRRRTSAGPSRDYAFVATPPHLKAGQS